MRSLQVNSVAGCVSQSEVVCSFVAAYPCAAQLPDHANSGARRYS
jgi:hypothetical protein